MITLELAQQFLYDKKIQIYSPHSHWIKDYKVISVPISKFNSWLEERRENQILELV